MFTGSYSKRPPPQCQALVQTQLNVMESIGTTETGAAAKQNLTSPTIKKQSKLVPIDDLQINHRPLLANAN